jgi:hypothetical protein
VVGDGVSVTGSGVAAGDGVNDADSDVAADVGVGVGATGGVVSRLASSSTAEYPSR